MVVVFGRLGVFFFIQVTTLRAFHRNTSYHLFNYPCTIISFYKIPQKHFMFSLVVWKPLVCDFS